MIQLLRAVVVFLGCAFIFSGLGWYVSPSASAESLGMVLLDGLGRSTQVADLAALFITAGACVLTGVISRNRIWFYPSAMIMGIAATGRILAWLLHDAAPAIGMIVAELIFAILFVLASRKLSDNGV